MIYPRCADSRNEELGTIGVLSGISHREETRFVMGIVEVLIWDRA
jgi:hypothetical protein